MKYNIRFPYNTVLTQPEEEKPACTLQIHSVRTLEASCFRTRRLLINWVVFVNIAAVHQECGFIYQRTAKSVNQNFEVMFDSDVSLSCAPWPAGGAMEAA